MFQNHLVSETSEKTFTNSIILACTFKITLFFLIISDKKDKITKKYSGLIN